MGSDQSVGLVTGCLIRGNKMTPWSAGPAAIAAELPDQGVIC